jgi:hypothetical protein
VNVKVQDSVLYSGWGLVRIYSFRLGLCTVSGGVSAEVTVQGGAMSYFRVAGGVSAFAK